MTKEELLEKLNHKTVIDNTTECWLWKGHKSWFGHGLITIKNKVTNIHRLSAHIFLDFDLESKLQINHKITCIHPNCWNPEHIYIGTQSENIRDRYKKGEIHWHTGKFKTHCKYGHELSGDNLYTWHKQHGCRLCRNQYAQALRNKRKQK